MANQWFKFFGGEYLSDPKMLGLSPSERSCWLTVLCYASISDIPGEIKYLTEERLMIMAGLEMGSDEWDVTRGCYMKFASLGMVKLSDNGDVTVCNFRKRQETTLSVAERVRKFRERNANVTDVTNGNANANDRIEENRVDKNKEEKRESQSLRSLFQERIKKFDSEEQEKFLSYWTEKNSNGKKERWQMEKVFDVSRRWATWIRNKETKFGRKPKQSEEPDMSKMTSSQIARMVQG